MLPNPPSSPTQTVPGQIRVCSLFSESGQTLLRLNCPPCSKADIGQTIQGINCLSGSHAAHFVCKLTRPRQQFSRPVLRCGHRATVTQALWL